METRFADLLAPNLHLFVKGALNKEVNRSIIQTVGNTIFRSSRWNQKEKYVKVRTDVFEYPSLLFKHACANRCYHCSGGWRRAGGGGTLSVTTLLFSGEFTGLGIFERGGTGPLIRGKIIWEDIKLIRRENYMGRHQIHSVGDACHFPNSNFGPRETFFSSYYFTSRSRVYYNN